MRYAVLAVCVWSWSALVQAQPAPLKLPPTDVSPVTIFPATGPRPKVAASFPASGQALPGGVLVLTVTFDQPMAPGAFDLKPAAGAEALPCLRTPRLLEDGKTFAWLCTTEGGKSYAFAINGAAEGGFVSTGGRRAETGALAFTTTADSGGPRSIAEAMKQAKLQAFDVPIQEDPNPRGRPAP